ncbi:MAG: amidohydrolase [Brevundimonas sp.]|uniref:amidohydrolase n=1 Tax=Brevundimonas sp. TaxID=1871086 RepID=UPI002736B6C2|nr:amidohydrolase [Brevundimonas sp.]MDP3657079.1 amidohydrolase [Brevundimonas sp.]MDZ4113161.1 amidohydrolase [Brevundimonas sp.]
MRLLLATTAALALFTAGAVQARTGLTDDALRQSIARDYDANLGALFDDFHRNPELSGLEVRTAGIMAAQLTALGYEVATGIGGTGVVAVLRNGEGPTVMIRADMDGLPLDEQSGLANASTARQVDSDGIEKPVMHACGHDVHITALIGTARQMMARRQDWSGTLVLVAQPAEERIFGARAMVEDGLYTRFPKPDIALAFHVSADLATGLIDLPLGITSSSSDSVDIAVHGVGTHGAYPHLGVDPIVVASAIVMNLQTLPSRSINPLEGAIVTVGSFHGGIKHNIISDRVDLQLTVRADNPETRLALLDGIDRVARGTALALGVAEDRLPTVVRSPTETTPPTINDAATAARVRAAIGAAMGPDRLVDTPRSGMGAEDFAYFVTPESGVKGVYFSVGGTPAAEVATAPGHHSPLFRIAPRPSVVTGVEAMVVAAQALMPKG